MTKAILLVGVGGQGTLLASRILSAGLVKAGYDLKMSEIHGMAQRGGSVITQIKYGEKVYAPLVGLGEADLLIAFEKIEALRWLPYLKDKGILLVNDLEIYPLPVLSGKEIYPQNVEDYLQDKVENFQLLKAHWLAGELGNYRVQNMIILAAGVKALGLENLNWPAILAAHLPANLLEINNRAWEIGLKGEEKNASKTC